MLRIKKLKKTLNTYSKITKKLNLKTLKYYEALGSRTIELDTLFSGASFQMQQFILVILLNRPWKSNLKCNKILCIHALMA